MGDETTRLFFHHDNALVHAALQTLAKMENLSWTKINQPPYSPEVAPPNCLLKRSVDHFLQGRRFTEADKVREVLDDFFKSKPTKFYYRDGIHSMR